MARQRAERSRQQAWDQQISCGNYGVARERMVRLLLLTGRAGLIGPAGPFPEKEV